MSGFIWVLRTLTIISRKIYSMENFNDQDANGHPTLDEVTTFLEDKTIASRHLVDALQQKRPVTTQPDAQQDDDQRLKNRNSDCPMILNF